MLRAQRKTSLIRTGQREQIVDQGLHAPGFRQQSGSGQLAVQQFGVDQRHLEAGMMVASGLRNSWDASLTNRRCAA